MGECAKADYQARLPRRLELSETFGERRQGGSRLSRLVEGQANDPAGDPVRRLRHAPVAAFARASSEAAARASTASAPCCRKRALRCVERAAGRSATKPTASSSRPSCGARARGRRRSSSNRRGAAPRRRSRSPRCHAVTADDPVLLAMPSDHFIAQPRRSSARWSAARRSRARADRRLRRAARVRRDGLRLHPRERRVCRGIRGKARRGESGANTSHSGQYLWNAGIFAVRASVWIDAIGNFRPEILKACERAYRQGKRDGGFLRVDPASFADCPPDSIDYAVMENTSRRDGGAARRRLVGRRRLGRALGDRGEGRRRQRDPRRRARRRHAQRARSSRSIACSPASGSTTWWWSRRPTR